VRAGLLRRQRDQLAPAYLVRSPGLLDIGLKLHDAGLDIETGAEAAALVRHSMRRAAGKLVRHFVKRSGRGFARSRSAGDLGEALTALRPLVAGRYVWYSHKRSNELCELRWKRERSRVRKGGRDDLLARFPGGGLAGGLKGIARTESRRMPWP
jgi:hypothetical protein